MDMYALDFTLHVYVNAHEGTTVRPPSSSHTHTSNSSVAPTLTTTPAKSFYSFKSAGFYRTSSVGLCAS